MANVAVQNTSASLSGNTLATLEGSQSITGSKTFDLGASAPFVCVSGAAVVANLDADLLDGRHGSAYPILASANAFTSTNTFAENVALAATKKLFLDGVGMAGDTYVQESAGNVLSLLSGGIEAKFTSGVLTVSGGGTHTFSAGVNGVNGVSVTNTTTGTVAEALLRLLAGTTDAFLESFSQGFTLSGSGIPSSTRLLARGTAGLTIQADDAAGVIRFYPGGATERARFLAAGGLVWGDTAQLGSTPAGIASKVDQSTTFNFCAQPASDVGGGKFHTFLNAAGTEQGTITATNSTTTAYNTSSDARLKRSLGTAVDLSALLAVRVHDFEWLTTDGGTARGVFAQEVAAIMPKVVTTGSDERNADGALVTPWSVDYSKFVPDLIVAVQQAHARIAALEGARG